LSLVLLLLGGFWVSFLHLLLVVEVMMYLLVLGVAAVQLAARAGYWPFLVGIPLAWMIMHLAWGGSFLWGILSRE
jgi:hypothetical protein